MVDKSTSRRRFLRTTGATAVALAGVASTGVGASAIIVVDPDSESGYDSIRAAEDAAEPGDVISVKPATYNERVVIETDGLTLTGDPGGDNPGVGPDAPTLDGNSDPGSAFRLQGVSGVSVEGFKIRNYGEDNERRGRAIRLIENCNSIKLTDLDIADTGFQGIQTFSSGSYTHDNIRVARTKVARVPFVAISLTNVTQAVAENNLVIGTSGLPDVGEDTGYEGPNSDLGIMVKANTRGDDITTKNVEVRNNEVRGIFDGAALNVDAQLVDTESETTVITRDVKIKNNIIKDRNRGNGILFDSTNFDGSVGTSKVESVTVEGNTIENFRNGIAFFDGTNQGMNDITVTENSITGSQFGVGVGVDTPAEGITVTTNDIADSEEFAAINIGTGELSAPCNFWGDPTGPDAPTNPKGKGGDIGQGVVINTYLPQSFEKVSDSACVPVGGGGEN